MDILTNSVIHAGDLPKHTNEEVWNGQESMNLMFNVSLHKVSSGISVNVNTAKLRLFKQLVICNSKTSNEVCIGHVIFKYCMYV